MVKLWVGNLNSFRRCNVEDRHLETESRECYDLIVSSSELNMCGLVGSCAWIANDTVEGGVLDIINTNLIRCVD